MGMWWIRRRSILRPASAIGKSADTAFTDALGGELTSAYLKLKHDEWNSYARHLTAWERDHTLDC